MIEDFSNRILQRDQIAVIGRMALEKSTFLKPTYLGKNKDR